MAVRYPAAVPAAVRHLCWAASCVVLMASACETEEVGGSVPAAGSNPMVPGASEPEGGAARVEAARVEAARVEAARVEAARAAVSAARGRSVIKRDEVVELFPTDLSRDGDDWRGEIHGWIYEPELHSLRRMAFIAALLELVELSEGDLASATFIRRIRPFLVDNERGKVVELQVGNAIVRGTRSGANGHFTAALVLSSRELDHARAGGLKVRALTPKRDARAFVGRLHVTEPDATIVISDIDDTVKISNVTDMGALLRATFVEEFSVVPGLAEKYRGWVGSTGHLHLISSSPWQLQAQLDEALRDGGFPAAGYSLKAVRLKDSSVAGLFADPLDTKPQAIAAELARYPDSPIVLVGDSGEKDPEVYGLIARQHPGRVRRIFIRDVTHHAGDGARWAAAFEGVPEATWQVFTDANELPASVIP